MMTDLTTVTDENVRRLATVALSARDEPAPTILDHWEVGTDVWLINFRNGTGDDAAMTATLTPSLAGGYAVAWYDPWGQPRYSYIRAEEV